MAASVSAGSPSVGEAKLAVAEQLCATELEAQNWRLRCFQAEAQLRLQRLHRRGEQHPRWPQDAAQQQELLNSRASLKALDFTVLVQETLRDLVLRQTAVGQLQDLLQQTSQEVTELEEEAATKRARATLLTEGTSTEDEAFVAREMELQEEKEQARGLADKLRERSALENDLAEQVALGQDQVESLQRQIQAFLPSQQQMQQEARQAQQESDKARALAQRRREAAKKLEEEVQQAEQSAEAEQEAVNTRLEQTRTELSETSASTTELGEQARKAQTSHNRQMKAVKTDGSALREALADVGQEKEDLEAELARLRDTVGSAAAADRQRCEQLAEAEAGHEALAQQVAEAGNACSQAEVAHAEASGTRAEAVKDGLQQARHALRRAEEAAALASAEADETLHALEALRAERTRMKGETGPEAAKRRVQLAEALTKEQEQLSAEREELKAQSRAEEEKLEWLRHLRDVQDYARSAAKESANILRVAYGDMAKSSRASNTARPGASPGTAVPEAANRAARKLTRHLDDFLRFMTEAISMGEAKDASQSSTPKMVNLNLPAVLKEAYMGKFVQSDDGSSQAQQLDSSKEKLKVLKRELNDTGHRNETQSLTNELLELRRKIAEGEAQSREDRQKCQEAQQRLREGFKEAGYHRNEAQTQAVQKVQRELGAFEREVALLRRERDTLKAEAEAPVTPAAGPSIESLGDTLQQKEKEVEEVRSRLMSTRERYHALVEEAGGRTAVEDLGFNVRYGSPRPLHRPCASPSPPRRPVSQGKADGSKSVEEGAGRLEVNKSVEEGRPDVAKVAAEGRPDISKGIEEGKPSGSGKPLEGKTEIQKTSEGNKEGPVEDSSAPTATAAPAGAPATAPAAAPAPASAAAAAAAAAAASAAAAVAASVAASAAAMAPAPAAAAVAPAAAPVSTTPSAAASTVAGRRDDVRSAEGGASPSNKDSEKLSTADDKAPATPATTPVATPAAASPPPRAGSEAQQITPVAATATAATTVAAQEVRPEASPSSPGRSSRALSTPWGDMEAARPESTPQSCSELASPSQLNSALAEIRRSEALSTNTPPLSPNASGQSLLRLEAAPSVPAESRLPSQVEVSPSRSIRPALAMSWADMEAAALDPSPKSGMVSVSEPQSPSLPSSPGRAKDEAEAPCEMVRPEPALQCQWQPAQPPPAPAQQMQPTFVGLTAPAAGGGCCWEPVTAVQRPTSPSNACGPRSLSPPQLSSRPVMTTLPAYQVHPQQYLQQQQDVHCRLPSPPPVYFVPAQSPVSMRSRSPSPQGSMVMNWTHIGQEASQFPLVPDFPAVATSPAPMQGTARRRPSDFAFSPRGPDLSPGISSRRSDLSPGTGTGVDSDLCSNSDVSRDVLGSPVSSGLVEDPWLGFPVRSPLRSPGRELRDVGRTGPLRRPVPSVTSPEWAEQAAEGQPVLPAPQLPSLEELFAQNMREQREGRKQRHQRKEQRKEHREPREQMHRTVLPSFEEPPNDHLCGLGESPDDYFYGKPVKL